MTTLSKHELVQTIREMVRTRNVRFDNSSAFLFNMGVFRDSGQVTDVLANVTEGMVRIHHGNGPQTRYSVVCHAHKAVIYLDENIRTYIEVTALQDWDGNQ